MTSQELTQRCVRGPRRVSGRGCGGGMLYGAQARHGVSNGSHDVVAHRTGRFALYRQVRAEGIEL